MKMNIGTSSRQDSSAIMRTLVFACLTLFCPVESAVNIASSTGPHLEHPENCTKLGNLKDPNIKRALLSSKTQSAWLPLRREDFTEWKWLDGTSYGERMPEAAGYDCALLRAGDQIIDDVACNKDVSNIICDVKETPCSAVQKGVYKCFTISKKTYIVHAKKSTWYMARQFCSEQNTTLATFHKTDIEAIKKRVSTELGIYDKAWIGLRRSEFKRESRTGGYINQMQYNWAPGQPCVCPDKECVIVNQQGTWEAANCSSNHSYLCYIPDPPETKKPPKEPKNYTIVAVIVVPIILVIIGVAVLCWCKKRQQRPKSAVPKEQEELLRQSTSRHTPDAPDAAGQTPGHSQSLSLLPWRRRGPIPLIDRAKRIKEEILAPNKIKKENPNILLLGMPGAGKSSLINSLMASLDEDGYKEWCKTGLFDDGKQITHNLKKHQLLKDESKAALIACRPSLWDCPGFQDDKSERTKSVLRHLLRGAIPEGTNINKLLEMDNVEYEGKRFTEEISRKIDLILYVHPANQASAPENLVSALIDVAGDKDGEGVPVFLVFNKKDMVKKIIVFSKKDYVKESEFQENKDAISAKFGLSGSTNMVEIVSSYSKPTSKHRQNRTIDIDADMCKILEKIFKENLYENVSNAEDKAEVKTKTDSLTEKAKKIKEEILAKNAVKMENPNILVLGHPGVGKSSLINSLIRALDEKSNRDWCRTGSHGDKEEHTTEKLKRIKLYEHLKEKGEEFCAEANYECRPSLWDCYGFKNDDQERTESVISHILSGAIKPSTNIATLMTNEFAKQSFEPDSTQKIDIILLVHDAGLNNSPENLTKAFKNLGLKGEENYKPIILVVNKMDQASSAGKDPAESAEDLPTNSKKTITEICETLGIKNKDSMIQYVSSYTDEIRDVKIDLKMCELWEKIFKNLKAY